MSAVASWLDSGAARAARRTFRLALASVLGRAPGFLIPLLIAASFGAGAQTDTYFLVYAAVLLVSGTVGQAVEVAIVPFAAREGAEGGGRSRFVGAAGRWSAGAVAVAWLIVAPALTLFVPRPQVETLVVLELAFAPLVVCWPWAAAYGGALVAEFRIATSTGSMLWRGAGALLGLLGAPLGLGLWPVAAGSSLGEGLRTAWLRRRLGHPRGPRSSFRSSLKDYRGAAVAQTLVGATTSLVPVVERVLAQTIGIGAISHLEYASRLLTVPLVLFDGAIAPHALAVWSQRTAQQSRMPSRREVASVVGRALLLAAVVAVALPLVATPLVRLLLQHGRFAVRDTAQVAGLLSWYGLAFVPTVGALVTERAYLAGSHNRLLALLSVGRGGSRILGVVIGLPVLGLRAFPVALAIADTLYLAALLGRLPSEVRLARKPPVGRDGASGGLRARDAATAEANGPSA